MPGLNRGWPLIIQWAELLFVPAPCYRRPCTPSFSAPGSSSIPIYFIDAESLGVERDGLDPAAWAFARAAGFEAKPGRLLLLPGNVAQVKLAASCSAPMPPTRSRARTPARRPAARDLPIRQCAGSAARGARLRARQLSVCTLSQGRRAQGRPRAAGKCRCGGRNTHHRSSVPRPRPHQHADQRNLAG